MSRIIHYKSKLCSTTTVCGRSLAHLSTSYTERPEAVSCLKCSKHSDVICSKRSPEEQQPVMHSLLIQVPTELADALAQFCKRVTFESIAKHAASKDETYLMRDGLDRVRIALRDAGFDPR